MRGGQNDVSTADWGDPGARAKSREFNWGLEEEGGSQYRREEPSRATLGLAECHAGGTYQSSFVFYIQRLIFMPSSGRMGFSLTLLLCMAAKEPDISLTLFLCR